MAFSQRCAGCGVSDFTQAEEAALGDNVVDDLLKWIGIDLDGYPVVKGGAV